MSPETEALLRDALRTGCKVLESARCVESEREANLMMASSILGHGGEPEVDVTNLPGGVQDAWAVLSESSLAPVAAADGIPGVEVPTTTTKSTLPDLSKETVSFRMGQGQLGKAVQMASLSGCLKRMADLKDTLAERKIADGGTLKKAIRTAKTVVPPTQNGSSNIWLQLFDERLREIRAYHARHDDAVANKRPRLGNPAADGYDLASQLLQSVQPVTNGTMYQPEEVMGKYLDLQPVYESYVVPIKSVFMDGDVDKNFGFADFLVVLSRGLNHLAESKKLLERKKYVRFLIALETYLEGFLQRTQPLLNLSDVSGQAVAQFEKIWRESGGCDGWEAKAAEACMVDSSEDNGGKSAATIDLAPYNTAEELEKAIDGEVLKAELARLGLKCGGRPIDRAKRLDRKSVV